MLLYNFGIFLLNAIFQIASLFNPRAKKWIDSRKGLMQTLESEFKMVEENCIWFHCASLGEFEQGRPLIEELNKLGHKIILSFYSPSGYEVRKNYEKVEKVFYLPLDTRSNAEKLLQIIKPSVLFVVKYDLWYQILNATHQLGIPMFLVSATFKEHFSFFKFYGGTQRKMLRFFKKIFVQDESSKTLLNTIKVQSVIAGDTRVDRVLSISKEAKENDLIKNFLNGKKCLLAGSSWEPDEDLLSKLVNTSAFKEWKLIVAPHDISPFHINSIIDKFESKPIKYSTLQETAIDEKVLIIDNIGMLSQLYRYSNIAYIGGGFGAGIHNTLEPAAFGVPLIFGPKYKNFMEAVTLVENKGAYSISNFNELETTFSNLQNIEIYNRSKSEIKKYLEKNKGATKFILNQTKPFLN